MVSIVVGQIVPGAMIDVEVQNVRRQNVEQITENVEFI
jgi:hypothetical protein